MSSTTMHFGPEWMRTKHQTPTRAQAPPSPPPSSAPSGASTYSALVSAPPAPQSERQDEAHPFRYSKEELLKIYREGGGKAGLGLEVERWEGVVREVGNDPIGFRELSDNEKKVRKLGRLSWLFSKVPSIQLFQGPLNSDLRRRQSTDYLSPLATQSLNSNNRMGGMNSPGGTGGSPLTNRFGGLRRRDSGAGKWHLQIMHMTLHVSSTFSSKTKPPGCSLENNPSPAYNHLFNLLGMLRYPLLVVGLVSSMDSTACLEEENHGCLVVELQRRP